MTTADGNPLTGDVDAPDVRRLLHQLAPARHQDCDTAWCDGCTAEACVTRPPAEEAHP